MQFHFNVTKKFTPLSNVHDVWFKSMWHALSMVTHIMLEVAESDVTATPSRVFIMSVT